jgi:hypothetical protein
MQYRRIFGARYAHIASGVRAMVDVTTSAGPEHISFKRNPASFILLFQFYSTRPKHTIPPPTSSSEASVSLFHPTMIISETPKHST